MDSLETELERARNLDESALADIIETVGFECTRCGACCKGYDPTAGETVEADEEPTAEASEESTTNSRPADSTNREPHTATVFPDEVREIQAVDDYDWRDVARPMPYGLSEGDEGLEGDTFEWALQTDSCGDCTFYEEDDDGMGRCGVHEDRPLICRTYPFSVALGGTSQPMGEVVESIELPAQGNADETDGQGVVQAHECEGLGRDISRHDAEELAAALKQRAIRELIEAIGVRDTYRPVDAEGVVVHDSEGAKTMDGRPFDE